MPPLKALAKEMFEAGGGRADTAAFDAFYMSLYRAWAAELAEAGLEDANAEDADGERVDPSGVPKTRRWHNVLMRWGDQHSEHPWSRLSHHIARNGQ